VLNVRTELVGACSSNAAVFGECLSTAAFCIIKSGWFVAPGVIFPDVVAQHKASRTMKHLLFVPPFLWEGKLETLTLEDGSEVDWLLAVPISDAEMAFAEKKGVPALEEIFEARQIDIFDLERASTL
jgi:hypothetical protein